MPIPLAVFMPNAPVLIPEVGRFGAPPARRVTLGAERVAERVVSATPDAIVLLSTTMDDDARETTIVVGDAVGGTFADFDAPALGAFVPGPGERAARLSTEASRSELPLRERLDPWLGHRALVPLYFLRRAGWAGPTIVLELARSLPPGARRRWGHALRHAAGDERWAIVVSGDPGQTWGAATWLTGRAAASDLHPWLATRLAAGARRGGDSDGTHEAEVAELLDVVGEALEERGPGWVVSYDERPGAGGLVAVLHDAVASDARRP